MHRVNRVVALDRVNHVVELAGIHFFVAVLLRHAQFSLEFRERLIERNRRAFQGRSVHHNGSNRGREMNSLLLFAPISLGASTQILYRETIDDNNLQSSREDLVCPR